MNYRHDGQVNKDDHDFSEKNLPPRGEKFYSPNEEEDKDERLDGQNYKRPFREHRPPREF